MTVEEERNSISLPNVYWFPKQKKNSLLSGRKIFYSYTFCIVFYFILFFYLSLLISLRILSREENVQSVQGSFLRTYHDFPCLEILKQDSQVSLPVIGCMHSSSQS